MTAANGGSSFAPPQISVDALTNNVAGTDFVQFAPTAAPVSIGGRVKTAAGRGIANARLKLVDQSGVVRYAQTNSFGYYRFEDVSAGETCFVTVSHKRYRFVNPTRVISVVEEIGDLDFIALSPSPL